MLNGYAAETGVMRMPVCRGFCRRGYRAGHHSDGPTTDVADGVRSRSHPAATSNRVLPDSRAAGAFSARVARARGRSRRHVELLLMAKEQISPREAPRAVWTFKGLLFRVGALMALEVLQPGKRPRAGLTDVRTRLVCLWRRDLLLRFIVLQFYSRNRIRYRRDRKSLNSRGQTGILLRIAFLPASPFATSLIDASSWPGVVLMSVIVTHIQGYRRDGNSSQNGLLWRTFSVHR